MTNPDFQKSELLRMFLQKRGMTSLEYNNLVYNNVPYDVYSMNHIDEFVDYIYENRHKKYLVIPDYDTDGVMSGIIAYISLRVFGIEADIYYPSSKDGYGLTEKSARKALKEDTEVVITTDNGISAFEGIRYLRDKGIDVLVTDHHQEGEKRVDANIVVDPYMRGSISTFKDISGGVLIYKLMNHLAAKYFPLQKDLIYNLIVFAGISTVSDVMPVLFENRWSIQESIRIFKELDECRLAEIKKKACDEYYNAFLGLYLLKKHFIETNKIKDEEDINESLYGYYVSPLINSARRMLGDSEIAFLVFLSEPDEKEKYILKLFTLNTTRKQVTDMLFLETAKLINKVQKGINLSFISFLNNSGGFAGLIAGKMMEYTGFPSIVFSMPIGDEISVTDLENLNFNEDEIILASARSPDWFDISRFLGDFRKKYPDIEIEFGGHKTALGMSIPFKDIKIFSDELTNKIFEVYNNLPESAFSDPYDLYFSNYDEDSDMVIANEKDIDDIFFFSECINKLRPFGRGLSSPQHRFTIDRSKVELNFIGSDKSHVKLTYSDIPVEILIWNKADWFRENSFNKIELYGDFEKNVFRGNVSLSFFAKSFSTI